MAERLIATGLQTPKRRIANECPGTQRQELMESQALLAIQEQYTQSSKNFDDMVYAAREVGALVRETLDFGITTDSTPLLEAATIAQNEATNCYGHTIVASECLERIGVEHCISYANQHTFVTLFDRQGDGAFMLDVATKELWCDMTSAIGGEDPLNQFARGELRAINTLYSRELLRQLPAEKNREGFLQSRPWLTFEQSEGLHCRGDTVRDMLLQMITLPSIPGRELLIDEYNAQIHQRQGRLEQAADLVEDLPGIYLDIDPRNKLKTAERLCRGLAVHGLGERAITVAEVIQQSLPSEDQSRNQYFLPDVLRMVAKKTGDRALAQRAIQYYETLPPSTLRRGKLRAAYTELQNMVQ